MRGFCGFWYFRGKGESAFSPLLSVLHDGGEFPLSSVLGGEYLGYLAGGASNQIEEASGKGREGIGFGYGLDRTETDLRLVGLAFVVCRPLLSALLPLHGSPLSFIVLVSCPFRLFVAKEVLEFRPSPLFPARLVCDVSLLRTSMGLVSGVGLSLGLIGRLWANPFPVSVVAFRGLLTATIPPIGVSIGFGVVGGASGVVISFSLVWLLALWAWFVGLSGSWIRLVGFLGLPHPEQAGHRGFIMLPYPERGKPVFASGLGVDDTDSFPPLVEFQPFFLKGNDEVVGGSRCLEYLVDTGLDVLLAGGLSPPFLHLLFGLGGFESFLSFGLFLSRILRVDGGVC